MQQPRHCLGLICLDKRECRAGDIILVRTQVANDRPRQFRFAGTQAPFESNDITSLQVIGQKKDPAAVSRLGHQVIAKQSASIF